MKLKAVVSEGPWRVSRIDEKIKPILFIMGKKILHTGKIGTASVLKVMTNYLATSLKHGTA